MWNGAKGTMLPAPIARIRPSSSEVSGTGLHATATSFSSQIPMTMMPPRSFAIAPMSAANSRRCESPLPYSASLKSRSESSRTL